MTVTGKIDEILVLLGKLKREYGAETSVVVVTELVHNKRKQTPEEAFAEAILNSFSKLI